MYWLEGYDYSLWCPGAQAIFLGLGLFITLLDNRQWFVPFGIGIQLMDSSGTAHLTTHVNSALPTDGEGAER